MSWLFKSFQSDGSDSSESHQFPTAEHSPSSSSNPGGVKEDLSVLGQTLTRQFRGVANFLAPPPPATTTTTTTTVDSSKSSSSPPQSPTLLGIRNDLVEIGGSFKTSLSLLSGNKAVSEISRIASNLLQFQDEDRDEASGNNDDDDEDGIDGFPWVTDEVLDFVSEISNRPELWTDFPLPFNNDFNMSDAQKEHASTIERLAPSLAALRVKLQSSMSDEQFWMIYFILLLPRLSEDDFELLSTSKIVEARDVLLQKLQRNAQVDTSQEGSKVSETQGENIPSQENKVSVGIINAGGERMDDEENTEKWLEEEDTDTGTLVDPQKKLEHEEDVSFSDLEDDDSDLSSRQSGLKPAQDVRASSPNGSNDWVQLNESSETRGGQQKAGLPNSQEKDSEGEESNDWLKVDDFD